MSSQSPLTANHETESAASPDTSESQMFRRYQPQSQQSFDKLYSFAEVPRMAFSAKLKQKKEHILSKQFICTIFPFLAWLPNYSPKNDLTSDVISGLTVGVMHLPQGLAYAMLAGVPPITGLYMAFFPVIVYAMMGTSRHVSMGTFSVVCIMTSNSVFALSSASTIADSINSNFTVESLKDDSNVNQTRSDYTPVEVATAVCFTVGVFQLVMGICKLGKLSVLLSDTLVSGFTTAAALHVLVSQLKNLTGITIKNHNGLFKNIFVVSDLIENAASVNYITLGISVTTAVLLLLFTSFLKPYMDKKWSYPFPIELLTIILGTTLSYAFSLKSIYNVDTVGEIPIGLPSPSPPPFELIPHVMTDSFSIAVVAYSVSLSMASILAKKGNYFIDANQELLASGAGNMFAAFFACVPFAASLSRSLIQQNVGGKTQIASLVSCIFLLLILLVIGPLFEPLPNSVLASIVIVALKKMFEQFWDFPIAWKKSQIDGGVWLSTFLASLLLDIDYGLAIGVAMSVISVVYYGQKLVVLQLGNVPNTELYLDLKHYLAAKDIPGVCIIQIAGGLHYANREYVLHRCYKIIGLNCKSSAVKSDGECDDCENDNHVKDNLHCVILDLQGVCFIDPAASDALTQLHRDLKSNKSIDMHIANCPPPVMASFQSYKFFDEIYSPDHVFPSIQDAVCHAELLKVVANK